MVSPSMGICDKICKVLIKFQIYFIDNPKNSESIMFETTPDIKDQSRRVNVDFMAFIRAKYVNLIILLELTACGGISDVVQKNQLQFNLILLEIYHLPVNYSTVYLFLIHQFDRKSSGYVTIHISFNSLQLTSFKLLLTCSYVTSAGLIIVINNGTDPAITEFIRMFTQYLQYPTLDQSTEQMVKIVLSMLAISESILQSAIQFVILKLNRVKQIDCKPVNNQGGLFITVREIFGVDVQLAVCQKYAIEKLYTNDRPEIICIKGLAVVICAIQIIS
ncbi:UNKNOWN [Stylonychia lemnae]|uniref:Uncharacterized protein n=1 Tax=Stylonychia lemnae TaxID=5949 RepID=A0A078ARU3_STYLE|nr:UNKNOWN [Stylonychia lemnae]|eukprot:CDW83598.1 UNKNOWN [Stylonychia lemnae]